MIQKETYSLENIKRIKDKYNVDPELAQRSIFALGLVETLSMVGTDFIFKGGSSLMLLNETPKRLSTDVDILVEPGYDIESYINKASRIFPFLSFEESIRSTNKTISKKHFRIKYASPRTEREVTIIVDVLFANNRYKKLEQRPIKSNLLICSGDDVIVKTPSVEEMLADKLTAFAPHTICHIIVSLFHKSFQYWR
ncbi:MAG: nucleotidyl transferase AbiEii/AbiGii toxin family protein [Bacilli bacterium]|nr:nucleotidyl transferase AbiEii/AbiGii toxin family protein [Bacilli bacterium]